MKIEQLGQTSEGVSLVIPVFNEEQILEKNVEVLRRFLEGRKIPHQILIVDNGSEDETPQIGRRLENSSSCVNYFRIDEKTVGGAFWLGVRNSHFEKIITVDADLSIDLSFIAQASELLNSYDVVVGSKIAGSQQRSIIRTLGSKLYIWLAKFLLKLPVSDYSIGAKAYRRSSIVKYSDRTSAWTGYVIELVTMAHEDGLKITEIPVSCTDMRKGKFSILHEGFYRYSHLFRLIVSSRRMRRT